MIAEVIPRLRTIRKLEILDYAIPPGVDVQPGMTVTIPFRSQSIYGVVVKLKTTSEAKRLREIESVVEQEVGLSPTQIQLVFEIAKRTGAALSVALLTVLQRGQLASVRGGKNLLKKSETTNLPVSTATISKQRLPFLKKTVQRILQGKTPLVVRYSLVEEVVAIVSIITHQPGTHLILVPQDELVGWWEQKLQHRQPVTFSSNLKQTVQRELVEKMRKGKVSVVVGTRGALFLPPDQLTSITVIDEEHQAYHQEQNPRLQSVGLAVWLSQALHIPCTLFSQSPRITTAYTYPLVDITHRIKSEPVVVNLQTWREHGGRGWFTPEFLDWIQSHLPVVLFFNRKGQFTWLRCQGCQMLIPMSSTSQCPRCQSLRLHPGGQGNQQLERVLASLLPQLQITHWDADSPAPPPLADILLTTNYALNRIKWDQFQGVGVISVDHQLAIPDFRSNERVLAQLTQLVLSQRPMCIQTSSPDHPVIQAAVTQNYAGFYDYELFIRKKLGYPPFGVMVEFIDLRTRKTSLQKFHSIAEIPLPPQETVLDILE